MDESLVPSSVKGRRPLRTKAYLLLSKLARSRSHIELADSYLGRAWAITSPSDSKTAILYGNMSLRNGDVHSAIDSFSKAVDALGEDFEALYKLGFSLERSGDLESADSVYSRAQRVHQESGKAAFRRGRCLAALGHSEDAVAQFHVAIRYSHRVPDAFAAIYLIEKDAPIWKRLETLREGSEFRQNDATWLRDRAFLAARMGVPSEAIKYFKAANSLRKLSTSDIVELAHCHEKLNEQEESDRLLDDLASRDRGEARLLGPGIYYKQRGLWTEAVSQFERKLLATSELHRRASLQFEIGHAYDRQYMWESARQWMTDALVSDISNSYRHYRLGVVLERMGSYRDAISAYAQALLSEPGKRHWWFRLAECSNRVGDVDNALAAYRESLDATGYEPPEIVADGESERSDIDPYLMAQSLATDHASSMAQMRCERYPTDSQTWRQIAAVARCSKARAEEVEALHQLSQRNLHLSGAETLRFVHLLVEQGAMSSAIEVLRSTRDVRFPDGLDLKRYLKSPQDRRRSLFAEYYESLPLIENMVFLESSHGSSIGCHPLALFREMSNDDRFRGFTFVWAHSPSAFLPSEVISRHDVILVEMHSDLYLKYLATSKYLINNVSFGPYFVRREGQVYLNTWHGTPLKTLGQSMRQGLLEYENLARNFVQATHVCSPNKLSDWALFDDHRIDHYASAERRITGSPRLDRLVNGRTELRSEVRHRLGVSDTETVLLYAPTWRGGVSEHTFDVDSLVLDLEAMASTSDAKVFFRAHRLTEKLVSELSLPVEVVPGDIDTNDLLAGVDKLVTDYSSIAFDFLVTGMPIYHYVPDIEAYKETRGLYLEPAEFPGRLCADRHELVDALGKEFEVPAASYLSAVETYAPMEDGRAAKRVLDFMLKRVSSLPRQKPLIVFHASLIRNGIASALLALLYALDPNKVNITLVVEGQVMRRDIERQSVLRRLPDYVNLAFRVGAITATPEEQWSISRSNNPGTSESEPLQRLIRRAWKREARRVLGPVRPIAAIEFDGYATLWADFISNVGDSSTTHLIWQHNQLVQEWKTKYPELAHLFKRYRFYDAVVPVAESLSVENRQALESNGFANPTPYVAVPNVLDTQRILDRSERELDSDLATWMATGSFNVVSVGRLSPEKNFSSLIGAWPAIVEKNPLARLTIIGSGLLRADLEAKVKELGITDSVVLAGQRANPYPAIRRADLFVLPSTHEGQPVVILEAMTLNTPVAAAYTPGTAELMELGYGQIIRSGTDGMAEDLISLLRRSSAASGRFDDQMYRQKSLSKFERLVLSDRAKFA